MSPPSPLRVPPDSNDRNYFTEKLRNAPLYAVLDTALLPGHPITALAQELLHAGVAILQYRHKGKFGREQFEQCRELAALVHPTGGIFIVNDRADVAALCGANGVHLGQQDLSPAKARQFLGEDFIIGYSTHNHEQVAVADRFPVDYLAIGPVYSTNTKQNPDPVVGLEMVAEVRKLTAKPLVAIGGITLASAPTVLQAGADAVAVVSDLVRDATIGRRVKAFLTSVHCGDES